jgi:hypothetical protein
MISVTLDPLIYHAVVLFEKILAGPSVEWADGTKYWNLNGQLHREDGPAVIEVDGSEHWYIEGVKCVGK